jgi:hypothetical protein
VSELVSSWARTVVPGALLAAAAAGIHLLDLPASPLDDDDVLGVEEVLTDGLEGEPIPAQVADEALPEGGGALLAAEIF